MNESTHDLIAAKAARLRELMRAADSGVTDESSAGVSSGSARPEGADAAPTWSGGWTN